MSFYDSVRRAAPQLSLITFMVFLSMYARVLLSPLLVYLQADLSLSTAEATRLFLPLSVSYSGTMLVSGFVARALGHRRTISLSALIIGSGLVLVSVGRSLATLYLAYAIIGAGAGFYPPSGVASVTAMVHDRIRGKAIAFHEVGPNSAFVVAPIIVAFTVPWLGWRGITAGSGILALIMAVVFDRASVAGGFRPERPHRGNLGALFRQPEFWAVTVFFSWAASSTIGVFAILPTFLINTEGFDATRINTLISLSRVSGIAMVFTSGYLVDRYGARRTMGTVLAITGGLTAAIGLVHGSMMLVVVFLQPMIISAFFPAAISAIADLGPPETRSVAVAFMIPMVNLVANGFFPTLMGALAERELIRYGFVGLGLVMLLSLLMLPMIRNRVAANPA